MKRRELLLFLLMLAGFGTAVVQWQEARTNKKLYRQALHHIAETQQKLLKSMNDEAECLKEQEKMLRSQLVNRAVVSLTESKDRMDAGFMPSEKERAELKKKISYVVDNMDALELSTSDAAKLLLFLGTFGKQLDNTKTAKAKKGA